MDYRLFLDLSYTYFSFLIFKEVDSLFSNVDFSARSFSIGRKPKLNKNESIFN